MNEMKVNADLSVTLKVSAKENEDLKVSNLRLTKMHNQLREELEKKCERNKKGKHEHMKLQCEVRILRTFVMHFYAQGR